jgi:hypothetical protein
MKIAFDLDNTLIQNEFPFPIEAPNKSVWAKIMRFESLREGTKEIFDFCKEQNWETWIYTTSFRNISYINRNFWLYDIRLNGVINQEIHNKNVQINSSKHPPTFGIDVIIDDSPGVKMESEKFNFNAVLLSPENDNWVLDLKKTLLNLNTKQHFP